MYWRKRKGNTFYVLLFPFCITNDGRLKKRENDKFFAGDGADVVVEAAHFDAGDFLNHCFHNRSGGFDELDSDLFEKIASFFGGDGSDQLLFRGGENACHSDDEKITDEV